MKTGNSLTTVPVSVTSVRVTLKLLMDNYDGTGTLLYVSLHYKFLYVRFQIACTIASNCKRTVRIHLIDNLFFWGYIYIRSAVFKITHMVTFCSVYY